MGNLSGVDVDTIVGYIDHTISSYSANVRFSKCYIFGSYGDGSQDETSDLDIIVGVNDADECEVDELQSIFRYSESILIDLKLDVIIVRNEDVNGYMKKACQMEEYESVYDIRNNDFVDIEDV